MKIFKRIIFTGLLPLQMFAGVMMAKAEDGGVQPRKLLVTAYYSPLPNQSFYIRGSYEADVILNGRGTNGADGTPVYVGMLAAPKTYPFGTRVKIPGLGVGEVHDRGGAILAHDGYDRIDVWMGYGEDGLARALNWGARTVDGEVYFNPSLVQAGLDFSWVSAELPASYIAKLQSKMSPPSTGNALSASVVDAPEAPIVEPTPTHEEPKNEVDEPENPDVKTLRTNRSTLVSGLGKDDQGAKVKDLQRMLWNLHYYQGDLTGQYDLKTAEAVFRLQVEQGVLKNETDQGAGYFGPKTLAALDAALQKKIEKISQYPKEAQVWVPAKTALPQVASLALPQLSVERQGLNFEVLQLKTSEKTPYLTAELTFGDKGASVVKIQELLIKNGDLAVGLNTGYFGPKTAEALSKFQKTKNILNESGRVGPVTLEALNLL